MNQFTSAPQGGSSHPPLSTAATAPAHASARTSGRLRQGPRSPSALSASPSVLLLQDLPAVPSGTCAPLKTRAPPHQALTGCSSLLPARRWGHYPTSNPLRGVPAPGARELGRGHQLGRGQGRTWVSTAASPPCTPTRTQK